MPDWLQPTFSAYVQTPADASRRHSGSPIHPACQNSVARERFWLVLSTDQKTELHNCVDLWLSLLFILDIVLTIAASPNLLGMIQGQTN